MAAPMPSAVALPPLPEKFMTIEAIRELSTAEIRSGRKFVSVIGILKAFREPISTKGTDYKCFFELVDHTNSFGIKADIFLSPERVSRPERVPRPTGPGESVILENVKVQMRNGDICLLSHWSTQICLLKSSNNPSSTQSWKVYRDKGNGVQPDISATAYALSLHRITDDLSIPSEEEFRQKREQAPRYINKFNLLENARVDKFYDIICQVVRAPYQSGDLVTMYVSDYTKNDRFYNYTYGGAISTLTAQEGDPYGYTSKPKAEENAWPGPWGKFTIQLTLFEPHGIYAAQNVKKGAWLLLQNVRIKSSFNTGLLEGVMHGDRDYPDKLGVQILDHTDEKDVRDDRFKDAVVRYRDYQKEFDRNLKELKEKALRQGSKRNMDGEVDEEQQPKMNSKKRRKAERALAQKKEDISICHNLNSNVSSNHPDKPIINLKHILKYEELPLQEANKPLFTPFTNREYKANVRVMNYWPNNIEDFSVWFRPNVQDMLSDYSGDESTDAEEEMRSFRSGKGFSKKFWEWRFALQVEEGGSTESNERMWLLVDNQAAQYLLGDVDDADNLRKNKSLLQSLKDKLFILWGDLEERKSAELPKQALRQENGSPMSSLQTPDSSRSFNLGAQPPASSLPSIASSPRLNAEMQPAIDSDDDMEGTGMSTAAHLKSRVLQERDLNISAAVTGSESGTKAHTKQLPKNKDFTCCIREYGVKVPEDSPRKADAGSGQRYQRVFGLFGTTIK